MTILAQVRHVFAKDVRESRWSLLIYVGVVVAVTLLTIHKPPLVSTQLFVVIAGIVTVAIVTMSDSPTQPEAFWASRPLHPLAVLGAKLLMAYTIVLGPSLVGQWIGLVRHDVGGQQLAVLMGKLAWTYASCLLIGMMVAAFTRDTPSLLVSLIALSFLSLMVVLMAGLISVELRVRLEQIPTAAGSFGSALLLAHVYRRRDTRLRTRAAAVAVSVLIVVSFILSLPRRSVAQASPRAVHECSECSGASPAVAASPSVPRVRLHLELNPNQKFERDQIEVSVVADSVPKNERIVLSSFGVLTIRLSDGSTLRLPVTERWGGTDLEPSAVPEQQGITWFGSPTETGLRIVPVSAHVSAEQRSALSRGVRSAGLDVQVEALEPSIAATIPLISGARFASHGQQIRVEGYSRRFGELRVDLTSEIIGSPRRALGLGAGFVQFALINRERGHATPLSEASRSGTAYGALPLGFAVTVDAMSLYVSMAARNHGSDSFFDEDWLRGAQLMILDWSSLGTYQVRAECP